MADKKSACCCDVTTEWLKIDPGCCAENRFDRFEGWTGNSDDDDVGGVKNEVKGEDDDIDDDDDIEEDDDDIDERRYLHFDKEAKPDLF